MEKTISWLAVFVFLFFAFFGFPTPSKAFNGKCPDCVKEGKNSIVYIGMSTTTTMNCGNGSYGENGRYIPPPPCNTTTTSYTCSNGHDFNNTEQFVSIESFGHIYFYDSGEQLLKIHPKDKCDPYPAYE